MRGYRRDFDETKYMSFLIKEDKLLEKNIIKFGKSCKNSKNVKNSIKKEFDSEPVYNEKYLKTKKYLIIEKRTQIFTIIKYQKNVLNLFVHQ